ncbi:MAG: zinc ribbon domain-containing protein [Firmicutes bacterium]|nr:zinc ribbon domain-containing protein [Bacillota bacterium]
MPAYDFLCRKCGKEFTVRTSISRRKQVKCPHCSSGDLQQRFGGSFFFLGSKGSCQTPPRGGFS